MMEINKHPGNLAIVTDQIILQYTNFGNVLGMCFLAKFSVKDTF